MSATFLCCSVVCIVLWQRISLVSLHDEMLLVQNCFLKGISPGCTLPEDTDEVENGWLLLSNTKCTLLTSALPHQFALPH